MVLIKHILLRILVVIMSFSFINGGGSLLLDRQDINILTGNHHGDIESSHQHHILTFHDEEKILQSSSFDFSCSDNKSSRFLSILNTPTQDYSVSVWQPPRFV
jgi:hypothetical protein